MEGEWSNYKDEDVDDSYLPDALEIAQPEAKIAQPEAGDEKQLDDLDQQQVEITSDTEAQNDTENLDSDTQGSTESNSQTQACDSGIDSHPQDGSHSSSSTTTSATFTPLFMAQMQAGPHHTLPVTISAGPEEAL